MLKYSGPEVSKRTGDLVVFDQKIVLEVLNR